jgi:hypothetical protein
MMKKFLGILVGSALVCVAPSVGFAQHVHSVPHATTHHHNVGHGGHVHHVPHSTMHYDNHVHYGSHYYPHVTSHVDAVRHYGQIDYVPHTTTHLHTTYPNSGVILNPGERIISSSPVISSGPTVVTQPPPVTLASSIVASSPTTVRALKPNMLPYTGRGVKIFMPTTIDASVNYLIDGSRDGEIRSGEEQLLNEKASYEIRFSRGETPDGRDLGEARYSITEGVYRFAVMPKGWDLFREKEVDEAALVAPTLNRSPKKNTLPTLPADTPIISSGN